MSRLLALVDDPTAGGTNYDLLVGEGAIAIPAPSLFVPVTSAQVDPGEAPQDRNDEVRGRRGNVPPISFSAAPKMTFDARAYPKLLRKIIRKALGGSISSTGTAPAAIESTVGPLQTGSLPCLVAWLVREEQLDRLTGCVVSDFELKLPVDKEGEFTTTMEALVLDTDVTASAKDPKGSAALSIPTANYEGYDYTFTLRDCQAFRGTEETEISNLSGLTLNFSNGMITDFRSKFRAGHNIVEKTIGETLHKLWLPNQHKIGAQNVTGLIDLNAVDASAEEKRQMSHAEKLVFGVSAGPLGTTPAADEMLKIVLWRHVLTGGGADPIVREGDQVSSYEFSGYLDSSGTKDLEAVFVGSAALT